MSYLRGKSLNEMNYFIEELGRGGFHIVWLAYHIVDNFFGIKVNHPNDFDAVDGAKFHKGCLHNLQKKRSIILIQL